MRRILIVWALLIAAPFATSTRAATLRVPQEYKTIPLAVTAASDGDVIIVGPGTYNTPIDFGGKELHLKSAGGPAHTILDVDGAGSVLKFRNGESTDSIVEGFQITGGVGTLIVNTIYGGGILVVDSSPTIRDNIILSNTAQFGGGIACLSGATPIIENNEIILNGTLHGNSMPAAGGGLYVEESRPLIVDNLIENNQSSQTGGGIAAVAGSYPDILDNVIRGNHAGPANGNGGGIACESGAATYVEGNLVSGNGAGFGAGLYCGEDATLTVVNNEIRGNATSGAGGGIALADDRNSEIRDNFIHDNMALEGGGIYCQTSNALIRDNEIAHHKTSFGVGAAVAIVKRSNVVIEGNNIHDNTCWSGAGMRIAERSIAQVLRNRVVNNIAGSEAGGVYCRDATVEFHGNVVAGNSARRGNGGGIYLASCEAQLGSNTIAGNAAHAPSPEVTYGGGLYCFDTRIDIYNTIFWDNEATQSAQIEDSVSALTVSWSLVQGGWDGSGNRSDDPLLVNIGALDMHLRMGSPCIDRGNDNAPMLLLHDIDGDDRSLDGGHGRPAGTDIGADELRAEIAVRYGNVNAAAGWVADVLRVNDSAGDTERLIYLSRNEPFEVSVVSPPQGPARARFVIYAWPTEPDMATITPYPHGLGWTGLPTPLIVGGNNQPARIWNNLGYRNSLGQPHLDSTPAPSTLLDAHNGIHIDTSVTFQGFIQDTASTAIGPLSATNAVVLRVSD